MDPPSIEQILESNLTSYERKTLLAKLHPEYKQIESDKSKETLTSQATETSTEIILTEQQKLKAKSEAQFRKDNFEKQKNQRVEMKFEIDRTGLLTIEFSREVFLPSYMVDFINQPDGVLSKAETHKGIRRSLSSSRINKGVTIAQFPNPFDFLKLAFVSSD